ncbi:molybdenum cofactor biosynthesis prote [Pholiota conissans]|uniref:Molybdenum cofactor biosynthesis prote n=1 Tax=Pholiota conissans TaxID=109636 RepID=A0A9P5ZEG1_9AGAR|nr:molybdenum cofactor biosynthesis prote [Pholiota conissans]
MRHIRPLLRPTFGLLTRQLSSAAANVQIRAQEKIQEIDAKVPFSDHLIDSFSRRHNYLRISLTERCNLRCFYCMPSEGIELSPDGKLLTNDEILRLATLFVKSGVTKIRLTGGEPTVRKGIADIIGELNNLRQYGLKSIGMTTNGLSLHRRLPQFVDNGLTHLNLSLDTLDPFKFELITRRRGHEAVLKALDVALSSRLASVKINVVVIKGLNDSEVLDFVEMTKEQPISIRFIEFMPFTGNKWDQKKMVPSSELLDRIRAKYPSVQRAPDELNDTARSWLIPGYQGTFGFISSMSDHFCASCNRLRLTADGQIKVCLFDATEVSLRDKMRAGASDTELLDTIGLAVSGKKEKHAGMQDIDVVTNRPMILIDHPWRNATRNKGIATVGRRMIPWLPSLFMNPSTSMTNLRLYSTKADGGLTHLDEHGRASMVDVSDKQPTKRSATASGRIYIPESAYKLVTSSYPSEDSNHDKHNVNAEDKALAKARRKGDALTVAQLAAIMGAKATSTLIPLCHPLALSKIDVSLVPEQPEEESADARARHSILCTATVTCEGKTGVEMEALTAVSVGLLTVWDMLKAVAGKEMEIGEIIVTRKSGGKSSDFVRSS